MTKIPKLTPAGLKALLDEQSCLLIDVREPEEFAAFHLPGSVSLPLAELAQSGLQVPNRFTTVVTICARGYRSAEAAKQLIEAGVANVHSLEGGLQAWQVGSDMVPTCATSVGFDRPRSVLFGTIHTVFAGLALVVDSQWALGNLALGLGMIANGLMGWCGLSLWFRNRSR